MKHLGVDTSKYMTDQYYDWYKYTHGKGLYPYIDYIDQDLWSLERELQWYVEERITTRNRFAR